MMQRLTGTDADADPGAKTGNGSDHDSGPQTGIDAGAHVIDDSGTHGGSGSGGRTDIGR
jgi:hypothetical protein